VRDEVMTDRIVARVRVRRSTWQELRVRALRRRVPVELLVGDILEEWLKKEGEADEGGG